MKGLIAFSFALREKEPNPCNVRLAQATEVIVEKEDDDVVVVAQWEIARALKSVSPKYVVEKHRTEGEYLGSEEVWLQAAEIFEEYGVTEVIVVANPFLHITKCRMLVKRSGFVPLKRRVGWIGFDRDSLHWYTRGPSRALLYAVLQQFAGRHGRQSGRCTKKYRKQKEELMKICPKCSAEYGILADYCGKCGAQLPLKRIPAKLQKQKVEHYAIICKGGERHAVQAAVGRKANFCIACGDALPAVK